MKQKNCLLFVLVLCLAFTLQTNAETIKYFAAIDFENKGYKDFQAAHPDVAFEESGIFYNTTGEFAGALLTKEFTSDLFSLDTYFYYCQQIMKKGFCVDLSGSEVIRDAVSRMHPLIAAQAMVDGKIYGVPHGISFYYTQINQEGWTAADLTEEDIPDSFPALLDFLERWCERVEASQEQNIRLKLSWVSELYNKYSYTAWLTELLIDSYIMQLQFANESLRFNDPELSALLERCKVVGARIYDVEPRMDSSGARPGEYQLFEVGPQGGWPQKSADILCFRLNDAQPKMIKASLDMYAVNPNSSIPGLCVELLEKLVIGPENPNSVKRALLYQGAEPIINPNYENDLKHWSGRITAFEEQLKNPNLTLDQRLEIKDQLKSSEYYLAYALTDKGKYYMSPAQLEDYNTYVDALYFPAPSVFNGSTETLSTLWSSEKQYASGLLTIERFLSELDRMAHMIEMENE